MLMITTIESYVQAVTNLPALMSNKDFLENLHPRYTEMLARASNNNSCQGGGGGSGGSSSPSQLSPIDNAIQNLLDSGVSQDHGGIGGNKHTIGIVGLLCAKTKTNEFNTNFENFLVQFSGFMDVADWGQLRMVAGVVSEIASAITDQMIRRNQPILGINLLGNVATRLQAHDKMLTCVHACVLQLCCASYNFKAGVKFIIDDFEEFTVDLKQSDNVQYLLQYLYYSGLIHTALKSYTSAIYFFEACTRVPAITLSHIMLESYKKYTLVCLIQLGEVPPPHKTASQVVNRVLKPNATAYTELMSAYGIGSDALSNCIAKNLETYRRDGNYGLVKQVRKAHMRSLIRKLTRTFLTLSLEDVGRRAGCDCENNPEDVVVRMIEGGVVFAKVNQRDGMVRFLDGCSVRGSFIEAIEAKINVCVDLNKRINLMNERISTNPEFISKVVLSIDAGGQDAHASDVLVVAPSTSNNVVVGQVGSSGGGASTTTTSSNKFGGGGSGGGGGAGSRSSSSSNVVSNSNVL